MAERRGSSRNPFKASQRFTTPSEQPSRPETNHQSPPCLSRFPTRSSPRTLGFAHGRSTADARYDDDDRTTSTSRQTSTSLLTENTSMQQNGRRNMHMRLLGSIGLCFVLLSAYFLSAREAYIMWGKFTTIHKYTDALAETNTGVGDHVDNEQHRRLAGHATVAVLCTVNPFSLAFAHRPFCDRYQRLPRVGADVLTRELLTTSRKLAHLMRPIYESRCHHKWLLAAASDATDFQGYLPQTQLRHAKLIQDILAKYESILWYILKRNEKAAEDILNYLRTLDQKYAEFTDRKFEHRRCADGILRLDPTRPMTGPMFYLATRLDQYVARLALDLGEFDAVTVDIVENIDARFDLGYTASAPGTRKVEDEDGNEDEDEEDAENGHTYTNISDILALNTPKPSSSRWFKLPTILTRFLPTFLHAAAPSPASTPNALTQYVIDGLHPFLNGTYLDNILKIRQIYAQPRTDPEIQKDMHEIATTLDNLRKRLRRGDLVWTWSLDYRGIVKQVDAFRDEILDLVGSKCDWYWRGETSGGEKTETVQAHIVNVGKGQTNSTSDSDSDSHTS